MHNEFVKLLRWLAGALAAVSVLVITMTTGCGGGDGEPTPAASATVPATTSARPSATPPPPTATAPPTAPTPSAPRLEPVGYPLAPSQPTDRVVGEPGSRTFAAGQGPDVRSYSTLDQVSEDQVRANASGWNCRVHVEYEGIAAVDWYVPSGTPVFATMDGTATLFVNTWVNAFDYYGVAREPYIGNPDRARAPLVPFPGPGGGMGVYVSVANDSYRTEYGHLDLATVERAVPDGAFIGAYTRTFDYRAAFAVPRDFRVAERVATWPVKRGDVIGYTGDAGYSEAPHLHYQITLVATGEKLCPTDEAGFEGGGWLNR